MFGAQNQQQQQPASSLFGSSTANKPSLFGSIGSSTSQPQQQNSLFGATAQGQQSGGLGTSTAQSQAPTSSLFGTASKPAGGLFSGIGQQQQTQQQPQQQQQQQGGGLFSGLGSTTQQTQQPQQQQQQPFGSSILGGGAQSQQQPQLQQQGTQQPQLGQTLGQSQNLGSTIWSPGRGMTGVHRTVPAQMMIVKDRWEAINRESPFRTYLYNNVGEGHAPFYQPTQEDDENKWEDALRSRPGPDHVPVLVKGFWDLGKRAQVQQSYFGTLQGRLHEINNCLTALLSRHDLEISVKIADCRRKHQVLSQRCLGLAAKTQVLRNRGYAMDEDEEELKKKLTQLERSVFDPSLNGRAEEIWARMLAIRERSKRLQAELDRSGKKAAEEVDDELDENAIKTAKKILDDYASQIQHLQKELTDVQKEFEASQPSAT
ncbi:hypothetical protein FQN54_008116 [Arachnomyces sp. PD_36]|nr:hypothetical protein FQN54_008116 [Arachnomyces sp. PD_36]